MSNYDDGIGDFSPVIAAHLLRSPTNRARVAAALASTMRTEGFTGVQVDLESLTKADRSGLSAFVRALRTAVRAKRAHGSVSVAIMAEPKPAAYAAGGYDVASLAGAATRVTLMGYDENGPWGPPGPIGALGWERTCIEALIHTGASPAKIDLGVATYGYRWTAPEHGTQVSVAKAAHVAAGRGEWSPTTGEWSAHLASGVQVQWSDGRSVQVREVLARSLNLHGVAIWSANLDPELQP